MSKAYQLERLQRIIMDPSFTSGLYLFDTDLADEEIESKIKSSCSVAFRKEELLATIADSPFELFVIGLSYQFENQEVKSQRALLCQTRGKQKELVLYNFIIYLMKLLSSTESSILHLQGELDMTSFTHIELGKLRAALDKNDFKTKIICKQKTSHELDYDKNIKIISLKEKNEIYHMEKRLDKVHITYKHEEQYKYAIDAIKEGLKSNNIKFSIDEIDILYRDNIEEYEKEISMSDKVIVFVTPEYLKSLDCMYEMTLLFTNDNILEKIFPIVDLCSIKRNGYGLNEIKSYWEKELTVKADQVKFGAGRSSFILSEMNKINDIISILDKFWAYIVKINTGDYNKLINNSAELLIKEITKQTCLSAPIEEKFAPSKATQPEFTKVTQNGGKSIYIENNTGNINIS